MEYSVYRKHTDQLTGSSVIGYLECTYARLVDLFGEPLAGDKQYSDAQWHVMLENGHPVGIANYKDGEAYLGDDGKQPNAITNWRVIGHYEDDTKVVSELVEGLTSYTFTAKLLAKDKGNLIKRLRTIADHLEEGKTAPESSSDYHSWSLSRNKEHSEK